MARTKQTPRNPSVDRPVVAVGSDIQSAERRPDPRPTQGRSVSNKGGKQLEKTFIKEIDVTYVPHQLGGIKKTPLLQTWSGSLV